MYETKPLSGSAIKLGIFKKCKVCHIRIKTRKINCPCCGRRLSLRTKRGNNHKSKIKNIENIKIST